MKNKIALILFLLISNLLFAQITLTAKVVGIKDGDTVVVLDSLNNQTTLRLAVYDPSIKQDKKILRCNRALLNKQYVS